MQTGAADQRHDPAARSGVLIYSPDAWKENASVSGALGSYMQQSCDALRAALGSDDDIHRLADPSGHRGGRRRA